MKIRTYGISKETLSKLTQTVFANFYLKTAENMGDAQAEEILAAINDHADLCQMLIMTTAVFCIGNFDRVEKIERWASLTEDGQIDLSSLGSPNLEFVV